MRLINRVFALILLTPALLIMAGCGDQQNTTPPNPNATATPKGSAVATPNTSKNASIKADPNPIQVCDGTGLGITKLTYSAEGPIQVEVRVTSPNGGQLAHTGPVGTVTSGKWVSDGMVFLLQDVSDNRSLTPENTLATVTVGVTTAGCK